MADDSFGGRDSSYLNLVYVHDPLLSANNESVNKLAVYPNPANDKIMSLINYQG